MATVSEKADFLTFCSTWMPHVTNRINDTGATSDQRLVCCYYDPLRSAIRLKAAGLVSSTICDNLAAAYRSYFRDTYLAGASYNPSAPFLTTQGLAEDWLVNGNSTSKAAIASINTNSGFITNSSYRSSKYGEIHYAREVAFGMQSVLDNYRVGNVTLASVSSLLTEFKGYAFELLTDWQNGTATLTQFYFRPFMAALITDALITYDETIGLTTSEKNALNTFWEWAHTTQWRSGDTHPALNYTDRNIHTMSSTTPNTTEQANLVASNSSPDDGQVSGKDLSLIVAPVYAWLYRQGYGDTWATRADDTFKHGFPHYDAWGFHDYGAFVGTASTAGVNGKHVNQQLWQAAKFIEWMEAGPVSVEPEEEPLLVGGVTTAEQSIWFRADITGRLKVAPYTSQTFSFVQRSWLDTTNHGTYRPILKEISGLGLEMGDYVPAAVNGSIVLDDSPHSYGYEQRFSDQFDRYAFVDQAVTVHFAQTRTDVVSPTFTGIWSGKVSRYEVDKSSDSVRIEVASLPIAPRVVTKLIGSSFTDAPARSRGQHIPLALGQSCEVRPVLISAEGSTSPNFAMATTLGTQYVPAGVNTYYAKAKDGKYKPVESAASTSSYVIDKLYVGHATLTLGFGLEECTEIPRSWGNFILTQVEFEARGVNNSAAVCEDGLELRFYNYDTGTDGPGLQPFMTTQVLHSDYQTQIRASSIFTVTAVLPEPLVMDPDRRIFIGFYQKTAKNGFFQCPRSASTTIAYDVWNKYANDNETTWSKRSGVTLFAQAFPYRMFGCVFTPTYTPTGGMVDVDGLGYSNLSVTQKAAPGSKSNPDLSKLDFVVDMQGLKDDSSGTITGSASSIIKGPRHVAKLLTRTWNGSSWVAGPLSTLKHNDSWTHIDGASTRYSMFTSGRTTGRQLLEPLLVDVCRSGGMRIGQLRTATATNLCAYGWGTSRAAVAALTDEDTRVLSYEQVGVETIVNRVQIKFSNLLRDVEAQRINQDGTVYQLSTSIDWYNGVSPLVTEYTSDSETLYGKRLLGDIEHRYINDQTTAEHLAEFYLATYGHPFVFVELEVPFAKYWTLDLLDVITITHPELPLFGGTSYDTRKAYTTSGDAYDLIGGHYWRRAQTYRAQIERSVINWNVDTFPTLQLRVRLLLNHPKDPT